MKQQNANIISMIFCTMLIGLSNLNAQNQLDDEGDAWIKERLEINAGGINGGEFIWNPTGLDLRFFTGFVERMRIKSFTEGGGIQIFAMDTITSAQDNTAGNVVRLSDGSLALRQYKVGDLAHGGIVFWVDETGEHGLVSSLRDLRSPSGSVEFQWSATITVVVGATGGTGGAIDGTDDKGAGAMNTMLIVSADRVDTNSAARRCADLLEGGYGDWYLPSAGELRLMFKNLHSGGLGGFSDSFYWSSSELFSAGAEPSFLALAVIFSNGGTGREAKTKQHRARAIRAF